MPYKDHEKQRTYLQAWRARNRDKVTAHMVKFICRHPERSLFDAFVSYDANPDWIKNMIAPCLNPLEMLIIKETVVT